MSRKIIRVARFANREYFARPTITPIHPCCSWVAHVATLKARIEILSCRRFLDRNQEKLPANRDKCLCSSLCEEKDVAAASMRKKHEQNDDWNWYAEEP
jgi:hypothetical protein